MELFKNFAFPLSPLVESENVEAGISQLIEKRNDAPAVSVHFVRVEDDSPTLSGPLRKIGTFQGQTIPGGKRYVFRFTFVYIRTLHVIAKGQPRAGGEKTARPGQMRHETRSGNEMENEKSDSDRKKRSV